MIQLFQTARIRFWTCMLVGLLIPLSAGLQATSSQVASIMAHSTPAGCPGESEHHEDEVPTSTKEEIRKGFGHAVGRLVRKVSLLPSVGVALHDRYVAPTGVAAGSARPSTRFLASTRSHRGPPAA